MTSSHDALRVHDRVAIAEALRRYVRGVDRKDWLLVRTAFHEDAFDDHGPYKGGVDGFIAMVQERHANIAQSIHMVTDSFIEFSTPADALVESGFLVYQMFADLSSGRPVGNSGAASDQAMLPFTHQDVIGRYIDHFALKNSQWRIQYRVVVVEQYRQHHGLGQSTVPPGWAVARRDGNDAVDRMRRQLGFGPTAEATR